MAALNLKWIKAQQTDKTPRDYALSNFIFCWSVSPNILAIRTKLKKCRSFQEVC